MATSFFGVSTRNRVLTIIGVIALSLWVIYPIQDSLKLGLDLNGGVQLVLRVKADEALARQPQAGVTPDDIVEQALRTVDRRVNELGVAEPVIQRYTAADQIAGYDLSLNVVAALLTIIGYSVNDTIVIFDRVRENARHTPVQGLDAVVNASVNQPLSRMVITAGTTFLSVVALYVFGGEALQGFAFTMLVGIVAGTYSTVFIASSIAILLSQRSGLRSVARKPRSMLVSE